MQSEDIYIIIFHTLVQKGEEFFLFSPIVLKIFFIFNLIIFHILKVYRYSISEYLFKIIKFYINE
jgi:hypothetical protein